MRERLSTLGVHTDSLDATTMNDLLLEQDLPLEARRILEIRQAGSKASTAKLKKMQSACSNDGRLRGALLYHGADTGRWSGRIVQPQNLPRPDGSTNVDAAIRDVMTGDLDRVEAIHGPALHVVSQLLSPMIHAPEGKRLLIADYASIEARVLSWLARQEDLTRSFRHGVDVFKQMAGHIYQVNPASISKLQRQVGKQVVLGCGFGMGAKRFASQCEAVGIDVGVLSAELAVNTYREKHPKIVELWKTLEQASLGSSESIPPYGIMFQRLPGVLQMRLPSGRLLTYQQPLISDELTPWGAMKPTLSYMAVNSISRKWERVRTYGCRLVENAVQAVARDLLAHALHNLESHGFEILLHVHDEIVALHEHDDDPEHMVTLMEDIPEWATNCPIKAEGFTARRYGK